MVKKSRSKKSRSKKASEKPPEIVTEKFNIGVGGGSGGSSSAVTKKPTTELPGATLFGAGFIIGQQVLLDKIRERRLYLLDAIANAIKPIWDKVISDFEHELYNKSEEDAAKVTPELVEAVSKRMDDEKARREAEAAELNDPFRGLWPFSRRRRKAAAKKATKH